MAFAALVEAEGMKRSNPVWTLPKASRDDVKKVFLSKKLKQDLLGRGSPGPCYYDPKRVRIDPVTSFAGSERPPMGRAKYPESSNDLNKARFTEFTALKSFKIEV